MKPSRRDLRRLNLAMDAYSDWKEYGLPERGGSRDQPALWHIWMRTIKAAIRDAETEGA